MCQVREEVTAGIEGQDRGNMLRVASGKIKVGLEEANVSGYKCTCKAADSALGFCDEGEQEVWP